jgi:hypothetical protein
MKSVSFVECKAVFVNLDIVTFLLTVASIYSIYFFFSKEG